MRRPERWAWPTRRLLWVDVAWAVLTLGNLLLMLAIPDWETIPFHLIWVSLAILYGFRVWRLRPTAVVLATISVLTMSALIVDVQRGANVEELTEVPLMLAMFLAMLWHARRRLAVIAELRRVSEVNLHLLERERRFIQNASHELRTPITIAIGHAELLQKPSNPVLMAADARVVVDELMRLRRLADRLLLLAAAESPDFLHKKPIEVEPVLVEALHRWSPIPRQWRLGATDEAVVVADADRLALALDALIENAVKHTSDSDTIELSVRRNHGVEIAVADSGAGIAPHDFERIFERFGRAGITRQREEGVGLGLALVKTIAEAHGGAVRVQSEIGKGSVFELVLGAG